MSYTKEEKEVLQQYFTNTDKDIFVLTNLPEVIKGTLFSRYSRTAKDLRRLFLDEFYLAKDLKGMFGKKNDNEKALDVARAEDFYERILVGYGDDSVAELGGAHIALENISVLATKSIEEHRIGLSPLEKSTRYVYYDRKMNGEYMFYKDEKLMRSRYRKAYMKVVNNLFDTYSKIVREIQPLLMKLFPGDADEKAYKFSIRAKACDIARGLLPLSTKTNMGVYGNGRSIEYILLHMLNDPLVEVRDAAVMMNKELSKIIGALIKRATSERGEKYRKYLQKTERDLLRHTKVDKKKLGEAKGLTVKLVSHDTKSVEKVIASIIYERTNIPYIRAYEKAVKMSTREKEKIIRETSIHRENRHQKPGRFLESPYFGFEITADWGVYKDLMRHRILTRHRQLFTSELGYWVPNEVDFAGFGKIYRSAMDEASVLFLKMKRQFPHESQYIVTHGSYNRFYFLMNLREAIHLSELRSSPQGHPTYRKVAQEVAKRIAEKFPLFGKCLFPFVDYKDYELERLSAFRKLEAKAKKYGVKGFEE